MQTCSDSNTVIPTGILRPGSGAAGLWLFFLLAALIEDLPFQIQNGLSLQTAQSLCQCLSSHISGIPHACSWVGGTAVFEKMGLATAGKFSNSVISFFSSLEHETSGGDSKEPPDNFGHRNYTWSVEIILLQPNSKFIGFGPLLPQPLSLVSSKLDNCFKTVFKVCENSSIPVYGFSWLVVSKLIELFKRLLLLDGIVATYYRLSIFSSVLSSF